MTNSTPLACNVFTFCCTAAFSHMPVFIAGAIRTGARVAITVVESIHPQAARHLADDVGRCGRDHKQIGTLSQRDMFNLPRLRTVKRIHRDRVAGERFKRQRSDKTTCILRHHNKNVDAPLLQQAQQLTCLINRNASGYAEDNAGFLRLT